MFKLESEITKRTALAEDVKHILDGIDHILDMYHTILDNLFELDDEIEINSFDENLADILIPPENE